MNYPQPPAGLGGIALTTQYFPLAFMLALFKPQVLIDGYPAPVPGWGRTVLPAYPGRHHVHVHVPYWLPALIGPADAVVDVYPGRLAELEYKAPVWGYSAGSLGSPEQCLGGRIDPVEHVLQGRAAAASARAYDPAALLSACVNWV